MNISQRIAHSRPLASRAMHGRLERQALGGWTHATGAQAIVDASHEHLSFGTAHARFAAQRKGVRRVMAFGDRRAALQ